MKFYQRDPKKYILGTVGFDWWIRHEKRPVRLRCNRIAEMKNCNFAVLDRDEMRETNTTIIGIFYDLRAVLIDWLCQIWFWLIKGFSIGRPLKIELFHWKLALSSFTHHCLALARWPMIHATILQSVYVLLCDYLLSRHCHQNSRQTCIYYYTVEIHGECCIQLHDGCEIGVQQTLTDSMWFHR